MQLRADGLPSSLLSKYANLSFKDLLPKELSLKDDSTEAGNAHLTDLQNLWRSRHVDVSDNQSRQSTQNSTPPADSQSGFSWKPIRTIDVALCEENTHSNCFTLFHKLQKAWNYSETASATCVLR
jgi:hypothetical protein